MLRKLFGLQKKPDSKPEPKSNTVLDSSVTPTPETTPTPAVSPAIRPISETPPAATSAISWFTRLKNSLSKTRTKFTNHLANLFLGQKIIDQALLQELETLLLTSDFGISTTQAIIQSLTEAVARKSLNDPQALKQKLSELLLDILKPCEKTIPQYLHQPKPSVLLIVGVNGTGKTTTIGKLTYFYQNQNSKILLAAGDTFRAGAIEQLKIWGDRNQVPVIAQQAGADTAAVIYDAYTAAQARKIDLLIADTAGRLQNQSHLMAELEKVIRVLKKQDSTAPHQVWLVLDASIGQNAIRQVELFQKSTAVNGLILTKLDGSARGGVIFEIAKQFKLPIYFLGIGEAIDDLKPFDAREFIQALLD